VRVTEKYMDNVLQLLEVRFFSSISDEQFETEV
jgi:hypothetical protein